MARPKEFDPERTLDTALRMFKSRGFAASSMSALTEAMGIGRQSLYETYGGKRDLYVAALERYADATAGYVDERLAGAAQPLDEIRALLRDIGRWAAAPEYRDGCLLVNSTAELASNDEGIRAVIARGFERIEDAYCRALRRAQQCGEFARDRDPRAIARFLVGQMQSVRIIGKARPDEALLADIIETALLVLN